MRDRGRERERERERESLTETDRARETETERERRTNRNESQSQGKEARAKNLRLKGGLSFEKCMEQHALAQAGGAFHRFEGRSHLVDFSYLCLAVAVTVKLGLAHAAPRVQCSWQAAKPRRTCATVCRPVVRFCSLL